MKKIEYFSGIVSIGTLLLYNLPFFGYVAGQTNEDTGGKIFLLASLVVIMLALNFMMTYLLMFLTRRVGRVLLALLSLINATAVYFIVTYSVMIDATTIDGSSLRASACCLRCSVCCSRWFTARSRRWASGVAERWRWCC